MSVEDTPLVKLLLLFHAKSVREHTTPSMVEKLLSLVEHGTATLVLDDLLSVNTTDEPDAPAKIPARITSIGPGKVWGTFSRYKADPRNSCTRVLAAISGSPAMTMDCANAFSVTRLARLLLGLHSPLQTPSPSRTF